MDIVRGKISLHHTSRGIYMSIKALFSYHIASLSTSFLLTGCPGTPKVFVRFS